MERGDLVRYISLSRKPAGATQYATHAHTQTPTAYTVSLFDRPTKSMLYFWYNALSDFPYIPHTLVQRGFEAVDTDADI